MCDVATPHNRHECDKSTEEKHPAAEARRISTPRGSN